ncbi:MAG: hypothetical protein IT288_18360 [Bdellovibrionales bacterium]|nr:hypothetical protein [Bdellovibrionales bacterium]
MILNKKGDGFSMEVSVNSSSVQVQLESLAKLQEIDRQVDHLQKKKSDLPTAIKELDQKLEALTLDEAKKSAEKTEVEKLFKQTQAAIEINQDRMNRAAQRLEQMENQTTFMAANKEVEQLKKLASDLDVQKAAHLAQQYALNMACKEIEEKKSALLSERQATLEKFSEEEGVLNQDIQQLQAGRNGFIAQVDRGTLARYDRIRSARAGLGIVPAAQGRCMGCNVLIPPQMYNQLHRSQEVMSCPSCARILFIPKIQ